MTVQPIHREMIESETRMDEIHARIAATIAQGLAGDEPLTNRDLQKIMRMVDKALDAEYGTEDGGLDAPVGIEVQVAARRALVSPAVAALIELEQRVGIEGIQEALDVAERSRGSGGG